MIWFPLEAGTRAARSQNRRVQILDLPGPKFAGTGMETGSTEYPYFLWVDQFDTLGLGKDTVIVTGTTSDSMLVFDPKKETFSVFRMAYPMPFYTRGLDGRIDDAKAGWKGRGIWGDLQFLLAQIHGNAAAVRESHPDDGRIRWQTDETVWLPARGP